MGDNTTLVAVKLPAIGAGAAAANAAPGGAGAAANAAPGGAGAAAGPISGTKRVRGGKRTRRQRR